ncbi:hypothetical protein SAMN04489761_2297 [Tenacibaculum sp. MAR_2009_124]|uniref:hypothetical protein n=1 Tax=Tenacibaculum sp. MAR_2009_124 TaxID=1250059 RepID=UPI000899DBDE|nr:hypothetical protein [Tenacibaculum sp. MAR_2009_124]SEC17643.1 hypothetical protein SAMN04489761_2297 [Tenacibaculum sp. MAR_2009_124]
MKRIKGLWIFILALFISVFNVYSQDNIEGLNLSEKQQQLLQTQKELIKNNREAFKASLTSEQRTILKNKTLSKAERQTALKRTLSSSQKNIITRNTAIVKKAKTKFRATLTPKQKELIRKRQSKNRGGAKKNVRRNVRRAKNKRVRN